MFSFNNPAGACPACTGLGFQLIADEDLVIPDKTKSIFDGAIQASGWSNARTDSIFRMYFEALAQKYHLPVCTHTADCEEASVRKVYEMLQMQTLYLKYTNIPVTIGQVQQNSLLALTLP